MALFGKVAFVTGSTDGIGRHTATRLAGQGATVLVHGRSAERVDKTVAAVKQVSKNPNVTGFVGDLASIDAVHQLGYNVRDRFPELHILVNNAGVYEPAHKTSIDGFEMTMAVNVFAPFLLTSLLLGSVKEKIINVSSISAASHIDFKNLNQERGYSAHDAYSTSKLCNIMFTMKLARIMQSAGVKVNCLDPGTVNTKMLLAGWGRIGIPVSQADNTFRLATDPLVADATGAYFVGHRQTRPPNIALNPRAQEQLWHIMRESTGAHYPGDTETY